MVGCWRWGRHVGILSGNLRKGIHIMQGLRRSTALIITSIFLFVFITGFMPPTQPVSATRNKPDKAQLRGGEVIQRIEGHCASGVSAPAKTWYLPEGSSSWGFECWLLIQNPNTQAASCNITYMIQGASPVTVTKKVGPTSRQSFNIANDIGSRDASIKVDSDVPVIPERAMYRNEKREGHDSIGTTSPARDYYLAEGTTKWGFTTYILVQNPNEDSATVMLTYMTDSGPQPQLSFTMGPSSRTTICANDQITADFSTLVHGSAPIIAERAMYWGKDTALGEACHDSIGVSEPASTWYLAEGSTNGGFETWVLVQNPGGQAVTAQVSYMTETGPVAGPTLTLGANSRKTVNVADTVPNNWSVSTMVSANAPVIAERSVYWNNRNGGHNSTGVSATANQWYLAEGSTNGGFETWVLIQNPGDQPSSVAVNFMTDSGQQAGPAIDLPAHSRKTINVADTVPNNWNVSTIVTVTSGESVIAERAMYWSKEIAPPAPAPAPAPTPTPAPAYTYDFSGSGNQATPLFGLQAGLTTFDITYSPSEEMSNFIVWLKDQQGNDIDLLANETNAYRGGRVISVATENNYLLNITASGPWTVHIAQPRPASAPGVPQAFNGTSDAYSGFITLNTGVANFNMTYQGDSNFIIWLYSSSGEQVDLVENEVGSRNDSKAVQVPAGIYILDIQGVGSWSVTVSQ